MSSTEPKKATPVISAAQGRAEGKSTAFGVGQAFRRPNPVHPVYLLIGRVTDDWAHLEHQLDLIIWDLAGLEHPTGACLTAQMMGVWPRYKTIEALLTLLCRDMPQLKNLIKETRKLSDASQPISEKRNRIIHDPWYAVNSVGETAQRKSMPKSLLYYGLREQSHKDLLQTIEDIKQLSNKVGELKQKIDSTIVHC